jgi:hypothetical protein
MQGHEASQPDLNSSALRAKNGSQSKKSPSFDGGAPSNLGYSTYGMAGASKNASKQ